MPWKSFQKSDIIDEIILVTGEKEIGYCKEEIVRRYQLDKVRCVITRRERAF